MAAAMAEKESASSCIRAHHGAASSEERTSGPRQVRSICLTQASASACVMGRPLATASASAPLSLMSRPDRKSTRLNSSHGYISYAVFCLKKKKQNKPTEPHRNRLVASYITYIA